MKKGLILYRGNICRLNEKIPFLYRYFKVLGQKISYHQKKKYDRIQKTPLGKIGEKYLTMKYMMSMITL